ncbi:MAG: hypothetical protein C5B51_21050 [Terriglobia bacterium]|nr:MAG: hypothetical protein C5B51_21050 [Terriglobia bacterium]
MRFASRGKRGYYRIGVYQMKNSVLMVALLLALALPANLGGQTMPLLQAVEPASGTIGDVLTATGENLGNQNVAALYLTDGKDDVKMVIVEQTATAIKFRLPAGLKAGRFAILILTTGKSPALIEEPVKVTVLPPGPGPTTS